MKKLVNLLLWVVLASVFMYFSYTIWEDYYFDDEIVDGEYYAEDFEEDLEELGEKHEGNITQEMYVNTKSNTYGLTTFEKAFQEVAYAYYMRWPYLHYNVTKGYGDVNAESPEEATSQDYNYLACGLFVMNVYKELLNIKFYQSTRQYAATYFGKRPEVIGYWIKQDGKLKWYDKDHDKDHPLENPTTGDIIPLLQIWDIIHHYGHEMLVYDLIYDDSGNVVDVYLIHANAGGGYRTRSKNHGDDEIYNISGNKVSIGIGHAPWANLYYNNIDNRWLYPWSRIEGTIKLQKFSEKGGNALLLDGNINHYASDYAILRFVTNSGGKDVLSFDGTYRAYTWEKIDNEEIWMDYYSDRVKSRLKYSKLFIEKTVDKRDNDMVEANQELTYTIKIQNNSDKAYDDDLIVKENINTNLVQNLGRYSYKINWIETNEIQLSNNGNQLQWNIGILNSGDEVTIEYTVKVKTGHIGETIESTWMIDNIPSGTLKNKIWKNTNKWEELKQSYNNLSGSYTGKILINQIYEETYGINLGLDNLKIQINTSGDVDWVIYFNNKWWTGSNWRDNTYLYINKKNIFSWMVLNSYFNALYKRSIIRSYNASGNEIKVQIYALPSLSTRENDPDVRANTIYPTDFQTGDILIYINENDIFYSIGENITVTGEDDNVLYSWPSTKETYRTYEDGEYAYIYIDWKFIWVNLGNDLTGTRDDRNEFTLSYYTDNNLSLYATSKYSTSLTTWFGTRSMPDGWVDWLQYQTLFGKDAYVVLRPSLMIRNINYELNGWENDDDNPSAFILGREVELKDPTRDGFTFQGWYTDLEYTIQVNNTNELMDDVMLYAKWKSNKCTFNWSIINHWESVTWYESNTVEYWDTCESEIRTCINWELSWTYQYWSCTVWQAASCTFNWNIINHWESVIWYESSTVEYWEICESEVRTCINWELSWTYQYWSCTEGQPAWCTFNGNIINHWESVTWYERSTVEYWEICESEIRTCTNWELSWTFIYPNCVVKHSFRWWVKLRKDNCPNGDFSDSYYDGRCWTPNNDNTHQSAGEIVYDILGFDSHYSDEMNKAYQYSYYYGITTKWSIEDADLYWNLTRIAMAKMLSQYALNVLWKEPDKTRQNTFLDVSNKLDLEYDNWVTLAYQLWIMWINMKDNKFRPYDTVSRAEFATALSRLLYWIDDGEDVYYSTHINLLKYLWIITNTDPTMEELRGYVMIMLMRSGTSL